MFIEGQSILNNSNQNEVVDNRIKKKYKIWNKLNQVFYYHQIHFNSI